MTLKSTMAALRSGEAVGSLTRLPFLMLILCPTLSAEPLNLSVSYHADSRDYSTLGVVLSSNQLPGGFTLWGFTDFHGNQDEGYLEDLPRSFSEYRLSHSAPGEWLSIEGLGAQVEYNYSSPSKQDVSRLGFTYKHAITEKGWLQWRAFPLQTNDDAQQLSLIFAMPILDKFSLTGFIDYNIFEGGENRWVVEPQLNYEVSKNIQLLLEYRFNEFEQANSTLDGSGVALGVRFKF